MGSSPGRRNGHAAALDRASPVLESNRHMTHPSRALVRIGVASLALLLASTVLAACNVTGSGLVGPTWRVTAVVTTVPAWQGVVPAAESLRYTITFANDGTAAIKADCNQVTATYTTTPGGSITITPGPATLAMCPPDSMGQPFVQALSGVNGYSVNGEELVLRQPDNSRIELTGRS
jgi:heat shock protein HslJ